MRLIAAAALVDGRLQPEEKPILLRCARGLGLTAADAEKALHELKKGGKLPIAAPVSRAEREGLLGDLIAVVVADGRVVEVERAFIDRVAGVFGLDREAVERKLTAELADAPGGGLDGLDRLGSRDSGDGEP
jgi:uncharacterized tellurite resistance protein B-like protein